MLRLFLGCLLDVKIGAQFGLCRILIILIIGRIQVRIFQHAIDLAAPTIEWRDDGDESS